MKPYKHVIWALALLAACDGNPFLVPVDPVDPVDPDPGTGIDSDRVLPPGTTSPSRDRSIFRREAKDEETGNGFVAGVAYNNANGEDEFSVDGLAFDGGNVYQRGTAVGSLGPFAVYEADDIYNDDVTGVPINQFTHRAIYGVSTSGQTEFAIVRTGAYVGYGFGGFIYQRNGTVTLPTVGQAQYRGDYAALRDFNGRGGLEYATGEMTLDIDFNDFNDGDGVKGEVFNRAIYDIDGQDITNDVLTAINVKFDAALTQLPSIFFNVGPGVLDANGEIVGTVGSNVVTDTTLDEYEEGQYYAVISGDATQGAEDEIVGIIVVEATDPRFEGNVTVRETGGFLLYRDPNP